MPGGFQLLLDEFEGKQPLFFFVNSNRFDTQGRYPYTLSIRDPQALFEFYSVRLHVHVIVDVNAMAAKFESHGLMLTFLEDEEVALTITNTAPNRDADSWSLLACSHHFFERLAYEFLSLEWFVEESAARHTAVSTMTDQELLGLQIADADLSET
jgi:hypothetical protein